MEFPIEWNFFPFKNSISGSMRWKAYDAKREGRGKVRFCNVSNVKVAIRGCVLKETNWMVGNSLLETNPFSFKIVELYSFREKIEVKNVLWISQKDGYDLPRLECGFSCLWRRKTWMLTLLICSFFDSGMKQCIHVLSQVSIESKKLASILFITLLML